MKTYTSPSQMELNTVQDIAIALNRIIVAMADVEGDKIRSEYFDSNGDLQSVELYDYYQVKKKLRLEYHDLYHKMMKLKEKEHGRN